VTVNFLIADSFTSSLARLTGSEQKAVKTTAFDLQMAPGSRSLRLHRLERTRDKNFWSVRASDDLRLVVHRTPDSLLLCYVDHHDAAYAWAERRKLETHPTTGAAQLVEIRELVQQVIVRSHVTPDNESVHQHSPAPLAKARVLRHVTEKELLLYGVPKEWIADALRATEDELLALADHLPAEAAEALLELATGGTPRVPVSVGPTVSPFDHPDAQRRFRVVADVEELTRALEYPWERWTIFLHPAQHELIERAFGGPSRVAGSAGTGKTIVAIHRAAHLARLHPDARILLTTFSEPLADSLRVKLGRLIGTEPRVRERIDVAPLDAVAQRLHESRIGRVVMVTPAQVRTLVATEAGLERDLKFSPHFLVSEWEQVVDAWQLRSWDAYREVARLGRKTRLPEKQRQVLWTVFERVRRGLHAQGLVTQSDVLDAVTQHLLNVAHAPYDFVVTDEAQDVGVAQLRFLAALGAGRPDSLFFAGDLGQRIFQLPFSWKSLGVDVRGRSATLRVNYRTSHQIRAIADGLLGRQVADVDGNVEERAGTVSVFNGPPPLVAVFDSADDEVAAVGRWLTSRMGEGCEATELAVLVRSESQVPRARAAVDAAGLRCLVLDKSAQPQAGVVTITTMQLSKGLEFRAVAVIACDDEVLPLQARIEAVADDADLEDVYETERHLLYVACTRARDCLMVSGVAPASEFLDDLQVP
jgi:KaiC/GvpD/RAD55 family RecA-like ATPase